MKTVYRDVPENRTARWRRRGAFWMLAGGALLTSLGGAGAILRYDPQTFRQSLRLDASVEHPSPPSWGFLRSLTDRRSIWEDSRGSTAGKRTAQAAPHPCGTDAAGRDLLRATLIGGTQYAMPGLLAAVLALGVGVPLGAGIGYGASRSRRTALEFVDDLLGALPKLVVVMVVLSLFRITIWSVAVPLGLLAAPRVASVIAHKVQVLRVQDFVLGARELGLSDARILWRELLLANCRGLLLAQAVLAIADLILVETTLGYLGFGLEGDVRSWGTLVAEGAQGQYLASGRLWILAVPSTVLVTAVAGLRMAAAGLERMISPE